MRTNQNLTLKKPIVLHTTNRVPKGLIRFLALAALSTMFMGTAIAQQATDPNIESDFLVEKNGNSIEWLPSDPSLTYKLVITGPGGFLVEQKFYPAEVPAIDLNGVSLPNGTYRYEIRPVSQFQPEDTGFRSEKTLVGMEVAGSLRRSGTFSVTGGKLQLPGSERQTLPGKGNAGAKIGPNATKVSTKDTSSGDDFLVTGDSASSTFNSSTNPSVGLCVGFGCADGEDFSGSVGNAKLENFDNRILFDDQTEPGDGFPLTDWRLIANDLAGTEDDGHFSIENVTDGKIPFRADKTALDNHLVLAEGISSTRPRVGINTATPRETIDVVSDNTPGIRFDDTGDGDWTIQEFSSDLRFDYNETPIEGVMTLSTSGDVGIGTESPSSPLHVLRSDGSANLFVQETSGTVDTRALFTLENNGPMRFQMNNSGTNPTLNWAFSTGTAGFSISRVGSAAEALVRNNGDLEIRGTLMEGSSRTIKDGIAEVDHNTVLAKLDLLPISEWSYTGNGNNRHMGPMAEDFHATFGLGPDNKHIAPKDLAGVALAAAKALKTENESLKSENQELRARLERIESRLGISEE